MNNPANTTLIITNIWIVGAWLQEDIIAWFLMISISLLWMLLSLKASSDQRGCMINKNQRGDLKNEIIN